MSVVSQTFPITTNGQRIPLNPPQQPSVYFKSVAIYNASGYLLTVTLPDGSQDFINPSTASLFVLTGNGSVTVQAEAIAGFSLPTNNVWAVFYSSTDNPGTYPIGLPAPGTVGVVTIAGPVRQPTSFVTLVCDGSSTAGAPGDQVFSVTIDANGSTTTEAGYAVTDTGTGMGIAVAYLNSASAPGVRSVERQCHGYPLKGVLLGAAIYGSDGGSPVATAYIELG